MQGQDCSPSERQHVLYYTDMLACCHLKYKCLAKNTSGLIPFWLQASYIATARVSASEGTLITLMSPCLESENLVLTRGYPKAKNISLQWIFPYNEYFPTMNISDMHRHIDSWHIDIWSLESMSIVPYSGSDSPAPIKIKKTDPTNALHTYDLAQKTLSLHVSGILRLPPQSPPAPRVKSHHPCVQHPHDPPSVQGSCRVLQDRTKTGRQLSTSPPCLGLV